MRGFFLAAGRKFGLQGGRVRLLIRPGTHRVTSRYPMGTDGPLQQLNIKVAPAWAPPC